MNGGSSITSPTRPGGLHLVVEAAVVVEVDTPTSMAVTVEAPVVPTKEEVRDRVPDSPPREEKETPIIGPHLDTDRVIDHVATLVSRPERRSMTIRGQDPLRRRHIVVENGWIGFTKTATTRGRTGRSSKGTTQFTYTAAASVKAKPPRARWHPRMTRRDRGNLITTVLGKTVELVAVRGHQQTEIRDPECLQIQLWISLTMLQFIPYTVTQTHAGTDPS